MKSHYCPEEKAIIQFDGQCNWCGAKEMTIKELTDEEIAEIYHSENRFSPKGNFAYYGFARAILRKAQEK